MMGVGRSIVFPQRKWFIVTLVTLGKCTISGAQCSSLLLADLTLSSNCSQGSLGERQSMLTSSQINPISVTMATLFMGPLGNDNDGWGESRLSYLFDYSSVEVGWNFSDS